MAVVTTIVAIAAVFISAMQWLTAKQKIAADSLEERLDIYEGIVAIVSEFSSHGNFAIELHQRFIKTMRRARFYFGPEVDEYLEKLRRAMLRGDNRLGFRENVSEAEFVKAYEIVGQSFETLDRMFRPYMRIGQRMPLAWWPELRQSLSGRIDRIRGWFSGKGLRSR